MCLNRRKAGKVLEKPKNPKVEYTKPAAVSQKLRGCRDKHSFVGADNLHRMPYGSAGLGLWHQRTEQSHHGRNDWNGSAGGWL